MKVILKNLLWLLWACIILAYSLAAYVAMFAGSIMTLTAGFTGEAELLALRGCTLFVGGLMAGSVSVLAATTLKIKLV